jgi:hypothetical protein
MTNLRTCKTVNNRSHRIDFPICRKTYIIVLGQTEELADLAGTLGTEALGVGDVGKAGDVVLTLLDNDEGEDSQVGADDATTDGLALALTLTARAVARVSLGEQELDTVGEKDTLLHGETLLVVSSGDLEDVALELVADGVTGDLLAHALLHEDTDAALIIDLDELLGAVGGVAVGIRERPSADSFFCVIRHVVAASFLPPEPIHLFLPFSQLQRNQRVAKCKSVDRDLRLQQKQSLARARVQQIPSQRSQNTLLH